MRIVSRLFGSNSDRVLRKLSEDVRSIKAWITYYEDGIASHLKERAILERKEATNELEITYLRGRVNTLRSRGLDLSGKGRDARSARCEVCALFSLMAQRTLGVMPHDSQLMGGLALATGVVVQMPTGEGKTLAAALGAFLRVLAGYKAHVVTVNDYLANRDAKALSRLYWALGLIVGVRSSEDGEMASKRAAYKADVLYLTSSVLGFDYLRDNLAITREDLVENPFEFAIVDEADAAFIDEAGTPLVINGEGKDWAEVFSRVKAACEPLLGAVEGATNDRADFYLMPAEKGVYFTDRGYKALEKTLFEQGLIPDTPQILYDPRFTGIMQFVSATVLAEHLYQRDVDYLVVDGMVQIVDPFTGRAMPDRQWGEGIHQAIETKEGVSVSPVTQTLATITYQRLFGRYAVLSGMTGTADKDVDEFEAVYGVSVLVIPSVFELKRVDLPDRIYATQEKQYAAVVEDVAVRHKQGQPVLIGTTTIEASEALSALLTERGLEHALLTAKEPEKEAGIIAKAGEPSRITIATNMAGRGTDIMMGGAPEAGEDPSLRESLRQQALVAGGLHVIGVERNDARRIDDQLKGRCARQGDPGSTQFFLSLDDRLVKLFYADKIADLIKMAEIDMDAEGYIESKLISNMLTKAQQKMEEHSVEARKGILTFDDVFAVQREHVYALRRQYLLRGDAPVDDAIMERVAEIASEVANALVDESTDKRFHAIDVNAINVVLEDRYRSTAPPLSDPDEAASLSQSDIKQAVVTALMDNIVRRIEAVRHALAQGRVQLKGIEDEDLMSVCYRYLNYIYLQTLDTAFRGHLKHLESLQRGIHLRAYALQDPKHAFSKEAYEAFSLMLKDVDSAFLSQVCRLTVSAVAKPDAENA